MVIALAREMRELGINYQQHLHVTAIDVDPKCVHMSYVQFALLHIPAVIIHGNTAVSRGVRAIVYAGALHGRVGLQAAPETGGEP